MTDIMLTKDSLIRGSYWPLGSIVEVSDEEARELIASKAAIPHSPKMEEITEAEKPAKKKVEK
jgi:hypothetical protein